MKARKYSLPSTAALTAFEAVARLRGFAKAAEELNTSQPAISRHIRNLEIRFGTQLFDRQASPIALTKKGKSFYEDVVLGLNQIQASAQNLMREDAKVTLACSHSVSHLLVMPRFRELRQALGPKVELRVMTAEYNLTQSDTDIGADIVFEYAATPPKAEHIIVFKEEIKPVGTPELVAQARNALEGVCPPPPLLGMGNDNFGWMNWQDWQDVYPQFADWPVEEEFDSYVYLLEAAIQGVGLALGWKGFVDPYLQSQRLSETPLNWHSRDTRLFARLTRNGSTNPAAHGCLKSLGGALVGGESFNGKLNVL